MVPRLFAPIFSNEGGGFSVIGILCFFSFKSDKYRVVPRRFPPLPHRRLAVRQGRFLSFYGFCKVLLEVWARHISQEGGLSRPSFNGVGPDDGALMGLKGLAVLIMGGLGNVEGAMAGGFILGIAEVFSVAYGTSSYRDAVAFGLIILILFIRPEGLFAKAGKGGRP